MKKILLYSASKRILAYEIIAFLAIILMLWLDELLDLPHFLLGAAPTPINWREALFETVIVAVIGAVISYINSLFMTQYFLLKKNEIRTKVRENRLEDIKKTLAVVHHNVNNLANIFQIIGIKVKKSETIDSALMATLEKTIFSVKDEMTKLGELEHQVREDTFEIDF